MITRDSAGRQVFVLAETEDEAGMTVTDGAAYQVYGISYTAVLADQASDTVASFRPLRGDPDQSWLFLDREGSISDDTGTAVGDYNELDLIV